MALLMNLTDLEGTVYHLNTDAIDIIKKCKKRNIPVVEVYLRDGSVVIFEEDKFCNEDNFSIATPRPAKPQQETVEISSSLKDELETNI